MGFAVRANRLTIETFSIPYAILCWQRALLDVFTPQLRAIVTDIDKDTKVLYSRFYYDGDASEKTKDIWSYSEVEASAGLGIYCRVDTNFEHLDYPAKIPFHGHLAFLRKEEKLCVDPAHLKKNFCNAKCSKELVQKKTIKQGTRVKFVQVVGCSINRITGERIETSWGIINALEENFSIIPVYPGIIEDIIKEDSITYVLLCVHNALLGRVIPQLRSVIVDYDNKKRIFSIRIYYDSSPCKENLDMWETAVLEAWADLGKECILDKKIERFNLSDNCPFNGRYAYFREK